MKKNINTYILPAHLACYLINNDPSGLTESEITEIDQFLNRENITVLTCEESEFFSHTNDLNNLGCTCLEYHCKDR